MTADAHLITDIRARAVNPPMVRPLHNAAGSILTSPLLLIDLETDDGVAGRAYVFGYTPRTLTPMLAMAEEIKDLIIGKPVAPATRYHDFTAAFRLLGRQGILGMVISGIDMALWDAFARARGQSVCEALGGEAKGVPAYDSYGFVDPIRDRDQLEMSLAQGFGAIKVKTGYPSLEEDVRNLAGIREVIGNEPKLMIDFNQTLTAAEAIRRIERLLQFDLLWVEEPVPAEDLAGHAEIRRRAGAGIQTGENWWFPEDAARALQAGACDYAMPDLMKIGGVMGWMAAAALCDGYSVPVSSHLFAEASAHVLSVAPNAHYLEYLDLARPILKDPPEIASGCLTPEGPGLGLEWDEKAVSRYAS